MTKDEALSKAREIFDQWTAMIEVEVSPKFRDKCISVLAQALRERPQVSEGPLIRSLLNKVNRVTALYRHHGLKATGLSGALDELVDRQINVEAALIAPAVDDREEFEESLFETTKRHGWDKPAPAEISQEAQLGRAKSETVTDDGIRDLAHTACVDPEDAAAWEKGFRASKRISDVTIAFLQRELSLGFDAEILKRFPSESDLKAATDKWFDPKNEYCAWHVAKYIHEWLREKLTRAEHREAGGE